MGILFKIKHIIKNTHIPLVATQKIIEFGIVWHFCGVVDLRCTSTPRGSKFCGTYISLLKIFLIP
jgi:hypothetical protein